jgi:hypothetical protein
VAPKKISSRLGCKSGENAGANMPQSAPIAGESEENYVSDTIPKEDDEKRPTPNPGIYSSGWPPWTKFQPVTQSAIVSSATGVPAEASPSVPVKNSQRSPAKNPSSPSFRKQSRPIRYGMWRSTLILRRMQCTLEMPMSCITTGPPLTSSNSTYLDLIF